MGEARRVEYDDDLTDGFGLDAAHASLIVPLGFGANANGSATRMTNAANESQFIVRDGPGRTVLEVNAAGNVTRTTYDAVVVALSRWPSLLLWATRPSTGRTLPAPAGPALMPRGTRRSRASMPAETS